MKKVKRKIKDLNLFQMYVRNHSHYGFWFDSWRWANTACRLLYFEYRGRRIDDGLPVLVDDHKHVKAICEFWDIRHRTLREIGELAVPWNTENYIYWETE